jgi:hypothetical protein
VQALPAEPGLQVFDPVARLVVAESAPDALATPPRPTTLAEARLPEELAAPRLVKTAGLWLVEAAAPLLTKAVPGPRTSALLQEASKLIRAC